MVPPVFAGSRLLLYAFHEAAVAAPTRVKLEADAGGERLAFDVSIDPARAVPGRTVATLAARARIRELEESPEWITARGSRQHSRKLPAAAREIIELATRHGLMSRETSYVAIERRESPVEGDVKLRRVPIALTTGWGDLERHAMHRVAAGFDASTVVCGAPPANDQEGVWLSALRSPDRAMPRAPGAVSRSMQSLGLARSHQRRAPESPTQRLILLQRADGSWDLTQELADAIGRPLSVLERALGSEARDRQARRAWATALALAWLVRHAAQDRDQWGLIADKARRWLGVAEGSWAERARETVDA
jgi:hypothetical protein